MCKGSREASFRSLKSISETLADEIIAASKVKHSLFYHLFRELVAKLRATTAMLSRRRMRLKELQKEIDDFFPL
jgi:hypothetical protein